MSDKTSVGTRLLDYQSMNLVINDMDMPLIIKSGIHFLENDSGLFSLIMTIF